VSLTRFLDPRYTYLTERLNMKITEKMKLNKTTPGALQYKTIGDPAGKEHAVGTLYLRKSALRTVPEYITITVVVGDI
jgi:hypothetical protein